MTNEDREAIRDIVRGVILELFPERGPMGVIWAEETARQIWEAPMPGEKNHRAASST